MRWNGTLGVFRQRVLREGFCVLKRQQALDIAHADEVIFGLRV